jgi:hypothetical protein
MTITRGQVPLRKRPLAEERDKNKGDFSYRDVMHCYCSCTFNLVVKDKIVFRVA